MCIIICDHFRHTFHSGRQYGSSGVNFITRGNYTVLFHKGRGRECTPAGVSFLWQTSFLSEFILPLFCLILSLKENNFLTCTLQKIIMTSSVKGNCTRKIFMIMFILIFCNCCCGQLWVWHMFCGQDL